MVDFWCDKCHRAHSNMSECDDYASYGVRDNIVKKQLKDQNRRKVMHQRNPPSGCVVIIAALIGVALVSLKAAIEVFT